MSEVRLKSSGPGSSRAARKCRRLPQAGEVGEVAARQM